MSYIVLEYLCTTCGTRHESFELRRDPVSHLECSCGGTAQRTVSALKVQTVYGTVVRGGNANDPGNVYSTRPLAEGQSLKDWKKGKAEWRAKHGRL